LRSLFFVGWAEFVVRSSVHARLDHVLCVVCVACCQPPSPSQMFGSLRMAVVAIYLLAALLTVEFPRMAEARVGGSQSDAFTSFTAQVTSQRVKSAAARHAANVARAREAAGNEVDVDVETALGLGVDAHVWARALAQARAVTGDWWDTLKAGFSSFADSLNVVRQWECLKVRCLFLSAVLPPLSN
jgi:hypothetical protein